MSIFDFDFEALSIFRVLSNKAPRTIIKTITGAFPLSWQDGSGGALADYKIKGKSEKCVTIGGVEYGVDDDVTLLESVRANSVGLNLNFGITPKLNTKVRFVFTPLTTNGNAFFGARKDADNVRFSATTFTSGTKFAFALTKNTWSNNKTDIVLGQRYDCTAYNGKQIINGTEYTETVLTDLGQTDETFKIGAIDGTGNPSPSLVLDAKYEIVYIWEGETPVLKAHPAIKNGVVGYYDLLTGTFFSPSAGSFTAGKTTKTVNAHSQIPVELYQEVSYLGLQGEEYINTGINPSSKKIGAIIDFQFTDTTQSAQGVFGSNKTDGTNNCQFTVYQSKWRTKINKFSHYGADYDANRHTVRFNMSDGTKIDDTVVITATQYTIASSNNVQLLLGACSYNGSATGYTLTGKLYPSKIYVDDALTLDYVPVKRLSDDTYGMYDLVTDTFFGNDGTGAFTGGSPNQLEVPLFHYRGVGDYCGKKNQLVQNGNFSDVSWWMLGGGLASYSVSNNIATVPVDPNEIYRLQKDILTVGHKYFITTTYRGENDSELIFRFYAGENQYNPVTSGTEWHTYEYIVTANDQWYQVGTQSPINYTGHNVLIKNCMAIDLTAHFGAGNEPTTVAEAKQRIAEVWNGGTPLPYYPYTEPTDYYDRHIVTATGGMVDMGTLNWNPIGNGTFYVVIYDKANGRNIYCQKYPTDQTTMASATANMHIGGHSGNRVYFKNTNIENTRQAAQEDLQGVPLFYQRDTDDSFTVNHYNVYTDEQGFSCGDVADEISFLGGDVLNTLQMSFDGSESWTENGGVPGLFQLRIDGSKPQNTSPYNGKCSGHFKTTNKAASALIDGECSFQGQMSTEGRISVRATGYSGNLDGFLAMLRAQSENGTPLWICAERLTPVTKAISAPAITDPTGYVHFDVLTKTRTSGEVKYNSRELSIRHGDGIGTE